MQKYKNSYSSNGSSQYLSVEEIDFSQDEYFIKKYAIPYFKHLFNDLSLRITSSSTGVNSNQYLDQATFLQYAKLPGIIGQQMFNFLSDSNDCNGEPTISCKSFIDKLMRVFISDLTTKMSLVFHLYDFDKDGYITKEDIKRLLSYIPMTKKDFSTELLLDDDDTKSSEQDITCENKIVDFEQVMNFLNTIFEDKEEIDLKTFIHVNTDISSELFYLPMKVLYEKLPCAFHFFRLKQEFRENLEQKQTHNSKLSPQKQIATTHILNSIKLDQEEMKSLLDEPQAPKARTNSQNLERIRKLSDSSTNSSSNSCNLNFIIEEDPQINNKSRESPQKGGKLEKFKISKFDNCSPQQTSPSDLQTDLDNLQADYSVRHNLNHHQMDFNNLTFAQVCKIYNLQKNYEYSDSFPNKHTPITKSLFSCKKNNSQNENLPQGEDFIESFQLKHSNYESYDFQCYLRAKNDGVQKVQVSLKKDELYFYKKKNDKKALIMHTLVGVFVKQQVMDDKIDENMKLWPLQLCIPPNRTRFLYFDTQDQQKLIFKKLKKAIGQESITDYYDFFEVLGEGQFGQVRLAINKNTKQKVAIKMISKLNMEEDQLIAQLKEIEVLKTCNHNNIIKFLDLFESASGYYLVYELCEGGDLFDYMTKRNFKISEDRVKQIVQQIALSLKYLHQLGIVHRDIKLENVMMSDCSDQAMPKLADFGLSTMLGPQQYLNDWVGTLGYIAPEIIQEDPYSFPCDIWSLGCLCYGVLSQQLPFQGADQNATMKNTITKDLAFNSKRWENVSDSCKDFISKLLQRDPDQRYNINQVLEHPWLSTIN